MAELGDILTASSSVDENGITVEMLDYDYINTCKDANKLRGIIRVLKSGREGIYPEVRCTMLNTICDAYVIFYCKAYKGSRR